MNRCENFVIDNLFWTKSLNCGSYCIRAIFSSAYLTTSALRKYLLERSPKFSALRSDSVYYAYEKFMVYLKNNVFFKYGTRMDFDVISDVFFLRVLNVACYNDVYYIARAF